MRLRKHWFVSLIAGISIALALWILALFVGGGWFSDAPGAPLSIILVGLWFVTLSLGWSLFRLVKAIDTPLIVRSVGVVAASLFAVGMLMISLNLIALSRNQPTRTAWPFWLLIIGAIVSGIANLLETGWGKKDVRAWMRIVGAACIGALLLIGLIFAWSTR